MIYFIQNTDSNNIKIGRTASVKSRLSNLNSGNDSGLVVLKVLNVENEVEYLLFEKFAKHRHKGEWFSYNKDLIRFIKDVPEKDTKTVISFIESFELTDIENNTPDLDHVKELVLSSIYKRLDTAILRSKNSGFTDGIRFAQKIIKSCMD